MISAAPAGRPRPAGELVACRWDDAGPERLGQPSVARHDRGQRLHERVHCVERRSAVHARVQVAVAGPQPHVEVAEAANGNVEGRDVALDHAAVEDDRGVRPALVGGEPVDDRVAADLLLAVARKAEIDGQLACSGEKLRGLEQHEELSLVVRDSSRIQPSIPVDELERRRPPQLERIGWLHVEMPVAEHRGGAIRRPARRGSHRRRAVARPTGSPPRSHPRGARGPRPTPLQWRRRPGGQGRR